MSPARADGADAAPASPKAARATYDVAVLQKALDVLEVVAGRSDLGLSELSDQTGASKASSYRILSTFESRGFLVKDEVTRKYSPGPRLIAVAYGVIGQLDLVSVCRPMLEELNREFDETVNLGVLVDNRVLYVDILESAQSLRMAARVGALDQLHSTGLGKALLSAMPLDQARRLLSSYRRQQLTDRTFTSLSDLVPELAAVAERGYAVDDEENEIGSRCVAVPVVADGKVLAAVSVSGPSVRMPDEVVARVGSRLVELRQDIERAVGASISVGSSAGGAAPPRRT